MSGITQLLSFENPVFSGFAFYSVSSIFKMFFLAARTGYVRGKKQAFGTPEDVTMFAKKKDIKVNKSDPDVERVRGNHLNDLENIPSFILIGFFYVLTNPTPIVALWHFRIFLIARILHTIAYQCALPQPSRALTFLTSLLVQVSMGVQILLKAPYW